MVGVAELVISFGYLIGPIIGSLLYSVGGYTAPFIVIGSLAILIVPIVAYQFNRQKKKT
jgi:MFS family permease